MAASAKTIKVLIIDRDNYFIIGLCHIISGFYRSKGIEVQFITRPVAGFSADIIFQAIDYGAMFNVWHPLPSKGQTPLFFLIRDQKNRLLSHLFQSVRKTGHYIEINRSMLSRACSKRRYLCKDACLRVQRQSPSTSLSAKVKCCAI